STSGAPMSPAWTIASTPASAAMACGRRSPWVSEMTPIDFARARPRLATSDAAERELLRFGLRAPRSRVPAAEDEGDVRAAEAERVGEGDARGGRTRDVRHVIEIARGIRL